MNIENKKTALDDDAAIYQRIEATETAKTEREKLSEMTFREKARYLLDYYGLKVLIIVAAVIFLSYFLYTVLKPKPDTVSQIVIVDCPWSNDTIQEYGDTIAETLALDPKKEALTILTQYTSTRMNDKTSISTFLFAGDLDIIIASRDEIETYATGGVFVNLDDSLPEDLRKAIGEDNLLLSTYQDENGTDLTHHYSIRIDNSAFVQSVTPDGKTLYDICLGIHPCSEKRLKTAYNVLRVMYGLPIPD